MKNQNVSKPWRMPYPFILPALPVMFLGISGCGQHTVPITIPPPTAQISLGKVSRVDSPEGDIFGYSAHHRDIKVYVAPNGDVHAVDFQPDPDSGWKVTVARKAAGAAQWERTFLRNEADNGDKEGDVHLHLVAGTEGKEMWLSIGRFKGGNLFHSTAYGKDSTYKYEGEIKGNVLGFHEPQVFCAAPYDCLAVVNGGGVRHARTFYSHWNGTQWCDADSFPLYDYALNPFVLHTVMPTGEKGTFDIIRVDQLHGFTDLKNPHSLVYSQHRVHQDGAVCTQDPPRVIGKIGEARSYIEFRKKIEPKRLFSDLISLSSARNSAGDFWVVWSYCDLFDDQGSPLLSDINLRLRHWNHGVENGQGGFDAEQDIGADGNDSAKRVAYNWANLVYDRGGPAPLFYLFYQKMRKGDPYCGLAGNGELLDCEDLCFRTVADTETVWGEEICPVRNVIMKQPQDAGKKAHSIGDNNFTGSAANGEIALIYQDNCAEGSCYVYVWRNH